MAKRLTKTQTKNLYKSIQSKAKKLYLQGADLSAKDMMTIDNMMIKYLKKL